ncbi:MAG: hypothetical protein ABJC13_04680 [Acidobacteriota bacterium]
MKRIGFLVLLVAMVVFAVPAAQAACPTPDAFFQKLGQGAPATSELNHQAVEPLDLSVKPGEKGGGSMATHESTKVAGCYYYYCYFINVDGYCCEDFNTCLGVCGGACGGTCDY